MMGKRVAAPRRRSRRRRSRLPRLAAGLLWLLAGFCLGWTSGARSVDLSGGNPSAAVSAPALSAGPSAGTAAEPSAPGQGAVVQADAYRRIEGNVHTGELILVSNASPFVFPEEQALSSVLEGKNSCYFVRDSTVLLAPAALEALNRMMADFAAQGGPKTVNVVAGHRTREFQQHLFDQSAERNGPEHAQRYVSQPGGSEHHTGYALDFSLYFPDGTSGTFDGTGKYRWIAEHAAEYGFTLRYPEDKEAVTGIAPESWHYRYVGTPHAAEMAARGLCLEEYLEFLRQYPWEGEHLYTEAAGQAWEVYFCPADALTVPLDAPWTVSGDNTGGFIVTVPRQSA